MWNSATKLGTTPTKHGRATSKTARPHGVAPAISALSICSSAIWSGPEKGAASGAAASVSSSRPSIAPGAAGRWPLTAWPAVPTRFLLCRDDRFFPADFQRRVVRERLGIVPDEMAGGHLPALGHPDELVRRLETYRAEL